MEIQPIKRVKSQQNNNIVFTVIYYINIAYKRQVKDVRIL